jgi:hypothetical protein
VLVWRCTVILFEKEAFALHVTCIKGVVFNKCTYGFRITPIFNMSTPASFSVDVLKHGHSKCVHWLVHVVTNESLCAERKTKLLRVCQCFIILYKITDFITCVSALD